MVFSVTTITFVFLARERDDGRAGCDGSDGGGGCRRRRSRSPEAVDVKVVIVVLEEELGRQQFAKFRLDRPTGQAERLQRLSATG